VSLKSLHTFLIKINQTISKKRKFVAAGIFKAELNEFLPRELVEDGYSDVEVRVTPSLTEIIIMATRTQNVLGEKGRRMIHSGDPCNNYVDTATRHVLLKQGVLGIKVKIMLPWDPSGKIGPKRPLPDNVSVVEPQNEVTYSKPHIEYKAKPLHVAGAEEPHIETK
jgi:ribosomal protein S3